MAAKNLKEVYDTNPSTTAGNNDLFYLAKSPYGLTDDSGIKYSDLAAQLNGTSVGTNEIYVSNKQTGTGTGSASNPFATLAEALAVVVVDSVIILDTGTYVSSDFSMKPITIQGYGKYLSKITVSNITLNDTAWQAATSPKIKFLGIGISGNITLTASATKANSSVTINDVSAGSFSPTRMGVVAVSNQSIIPTITGAYNDLSVDSSTCLTSISLTSDGSVIRSLRVNNTITPTILGACNGNVLTLSVTNVPVAIGTAASSLNDVIFDASNGSLQLVLDDTGYPVNGWTDSQGGGFLEPIFLSNMARGMSTFKGIGIGYDPSQTWGTYMGVVPANGGVDPTFFCGRNGGSGIPPTGHGNTFFGTYYNQNDKNYCFVAGDGTITGVPTDHKQVFFGATNGFSINSNSPRANFSVRAGTTGDFIVSAVGEIADGAMNNNEINPRIESGGAIFIKAKNNSGVITNSILGMLADPIVHTVSGATLLLNRRHNININTLNLCGLEGFLRVGDQIQVIILGTGETRIGTFGSQAIYFLDLHVPSGNYLATATQYSSIVFEYAGSDKIITKFPSGEWYQV